MHSILLKEKNQNTLLVLLAFIAIYVVWGTTYLAISFGLKGFPPFMLSSFRFFAAGLILLAWCLAKKEKLPAGHDLKVAAISGIVMLIGGSGLVTWSEQYIPSGQAAVVIATEPFMFLLLDKKRWQFYFSQKKIIAGLIIGFSGIVLFFLFEKHSSQVDIPAHLKLAGDFVLFASAILWVLGSLYSQRKKDDTVSNIATTTVQLLAAGIFSGFLSLITGEFSHFSFANVSTTAWGGLAYLIVMGSLIAYLAFTWLLSVRPPAQVSTHTYVNPVVAILMGWVVAHEAITSLQVLALLVILTGLLLANKKTLSH